MSKTVKTVGITLICLALAGAAVAGAVLLKKNHDEGKISYPWEDSVASSQNGGGQNSGQSGPNANAAEIGTTVKSSGVVLRALTSGVNNLGQATETFGYTVTPSNATDQRVVVSMNWVDTSVTDRINAFFSWSVDTDNKTITIAAKQDFANQAMVTIESQSDSSKFATVTVDCLKKHKGFREFENLPFQPNMINFTLSKYVSGQGTVGLNYPSTFDEFSDDSQVQSGRHNPYVATDFSKGFTTTYTKDREFSFSMGLGSPQSPFTLVLWKSPSGEQASNSVPGYEVIPVNTEWSNKAVSFGDSFGPGKTTNLANARAAIQDAIESLSNETRILANEKKSSYGGVAVKTTANLIVTCETTEESKSYPMTIYISDNLSNYSFLEPVTSISPEVSGIEF